MENRLDAFCGRPSLPPLEFRLYDPKVEGKIPTPIDERGLVDVDALIDVVNGTVDSSFSWKSSMNDIHHLHWASRYYDFRFGMQVNPQEFRNLDISKIQTPRIFHNWIHQITEPPPVPSEDVMQYRIETQRVVQALFRSVRQGKQISRNKLVSDDVVAGKLIQHFDEFNKNLEAAKRLPVEFQPFDLDSCTPENIEDMFAMSRSIGKAAIVSTVVRKVERNSNSRLQVAA